MKKLLNYLYKKLFILLRLYCLDYSSIKNFLRVLSSSRQIKVLDFGCGYGQFSITFADKNIKVYIYDKYPHRIHANISSIKKHSLKIIRDLDSCDVKFDAILIMGVFYLLDAQGLENTICKLSKMLKPGGYLILEDSNPSNVKVNRLNTLKERLCYKIGITRSQGHINIRDFNIYIDLLEKYSLKVDRELKMKDIFPFNLIHSTICFSFVMGSRSDMQIWHSSQI